MLTKFDLINRLPHLKHIIISGKDANAPGTFNFSHVMQMGTSSDLTAVEDVCKSLDPNDAVNIQFTSVSIPYVNFRS